jgi:DNA-directed RNA polymerase specialized sigma24 family protein
VPSSAQNIPSIDTALIRLLRQAQAGCAESAQEVFEYCRGPLLAVIRANLVPELRRVYDADDFLAETFAEVFCRHVSDEVLHSPSSLWPYLKRIAENKVRDARRKHLVYQRRNLNREVPLASLPAASHCASKEMSAFDELVLKELLEEQLQLVVGQLPVMLQEIIGLLLQGQKTRDITLKLQVEPKRVYRAREWLRKTIVKSGCGARKKKRSTHRPVERCSMSMGEMFDDCQASAAYKAGATR